ncbi:MAG: chloride channel protein [Microthrixaceae bacterium]
MGRRSPLPALVAAVSGYLVFVTLADTTPPLAIEGVRGFEGKNLAAASVCSGICARGFSGHIRFAKKYSGEANPAVRGSSRASLIVSARSAWRALTGESLTLESGLGVVRWALDPTVGVWLLVAVFGLRLAATTASVAGGAGGLFIPLVVAGALPGPPGGVVGSAEESLYAVVGIAAFLSAGYRVLLSAIMFVAAPLAGLVCGAGVIAAVAAEPLRGQELDHLLPARFPTTWAPPRRAGEAAPFRWATAGTWGLRRHDCLGDIRRDPPGRSVDGFDLEDITYHRALDCGVVRRQFDRPEVRKRALRPSTVDELYRASTTHARALTWAVSC